MSERPKVSFVCSVKDGSRHLTRCAQSVLRQSVREVELILVDDHSEDTTWKLMESLAKEDPRVRAVKNQGQPGLTYSLNIGLDFAKGEYVARIDVDDFAHADRAEKQIALLDSNPRAVMAVSCYRLVDDDEWFLYSHCPPADPIMLRWSLCFRNYIRHSTATWKRSLDLRYEPSFPYAQDYELWCRISRAGDIVVLPEMSSTIRQRRGSITDVRREEQEAAADRVTAAQWEYYTESKIEIGGARGLRLIQHMKSQEQFREFDALSQEEFAAALMNYFTLAGAFVDRESPDPEVFRNDVGNDIRSLLGNPSRREQTVAAISVASQMPGTAGDLARLFL